MFNVHGSSRPTQGLSCVFNTQSTVATHMLGAAFSRAVFTDRASFPAALRIGLGAPCAAGKTTFISGILDDIKDKVSLETPEDVTCFPRARQNLWFSNRAGWIRHYDCLLYGKFSLPSYMNNDFSKCSLPRVDVAEHPYSDVHDKKFDCLIFLEKYKDQEREITLYASGSKMEEVLEKTASIYEALKLSL